MERLVSLRAIFLLDGLAAATTLLYILTDLKLVPASLLVPFSRLASLSALPLTIAWILYFRGEPIGLRRFIYLAPYIVHYLLSPFRGFLAVMILCMLIPAIRASKRVTLVLLLIGGVFFVLLATHINDAYRAYKWGGPGRHLHQESLETKWETWKTQPGQSPWVQVANRFHGFDSMALTVFSVPQIFPYSNRNIISEFFLTSFVPRLVLETKPLYARGREFSTSIWALEMNRVAKRQSAPIAPTMPGDLFSIHGVPMLILGGFIYGLLVGLLQGWLPSLPPGMTCIMLTLFWYETGGLLETDFVFAGASVIQHAIALLFGFIILLKLTDMFFEPKTLPNKLRFKSRRIIN